VHLVDRPDNPPANPSFLYYLPADPSGRPAKMVKSSKKNATKGRTALPAALHERFTFRARICSPESHADAALVVGVRPQAIRPGRDVHASAVGAKLPHGRSPPIVPRSAARRNTPPPAHARLYPPTGNFLACGLSRVLT